MNNIENYLKENPELIKDFMQSNGELLNEIKNRFEGFLDSGDLVGKFLLSKALFEILQVTGEATKSALKAELAEHGLNITNVKGNC